ncbi:putative membrane protein [Halobacteriovorax marinus SJ]|uniref:Membrane protein n=1 Tax=Halobacteriovorax marinus (strain ATCC BAA-682 / DSM 15412 / SJ) TaxID=862908 RepID=E1X1X8_HALMS|nr:putative membrane protein [Halobacteriovorax marinus SJ]
MKKSYNLLSIILPVALGLIFFFPLYFQGKLFQEITPLQIDYSQKDYFFNSFSWIYSLNLLGEPLLANPNNGIVSLQSLSYLFLSPHLAYKINFLIGLIIFYYFSLKTIREDSEKSHYIDYFLALLFLSAPLFLSTTQRMSFWPLVWSAPYFFTIKRAIKRDSTIYYILSGLILSRTFSLGEPFLFLFLFLLPYLYLWKIPQRKAFYTVGVFIVGILPFLIYYQELLPLTARYYSQPESIALKYSLQMRDIFSILTNKLLSFERADRWFEEISLGLFSSISFFYLLTKHKKKVSISLICLIIIVFIMSMGANSSISKFILLEFPVFSQLRYPEKFTIYIFLILSSLILWTPLKGVHLKFLKTIIAIAIVENLVLSPNFKYIDQDLIIKKTYLGQFQNIHTRFKICNGPTRASGSRESINLRAFGIATLNTTSNISSTALKMVDCNAIVDTKNARRLGVSHILYRNITEVEERNLIKNGWELVQREGELSIFKLFNSSPSISYFTSEFTDTPLIQHRGREYKKNESLNWSIPHISNQFSLLNTRLKLHRNNIEKPSCREEQSSQLLISYGAQKIETRISSLCGGLLQIPWYFTTGWRAYVNNEEVPILRINDITMGLMLPRGDHRIEMLYTPRKWPFLFSYFLIGLLILSPILLKLKDSHLIKKDKV